MGKYRWLVGPVVAGVVAWGLSGSWTLGATLFVAIGAANYLTHKNCNC